MSHETNDQSGVQADPNGKPEVGLTAEPPARVVVRRRRSRWLAPILILCAVLAVAALVVAGTTGVLRYLIVGFPTTPMTVEKAERIASEGPPAGSSEVEVIGWLESGGIATTAQGPSYAEGVRRPDGTYGQGSHIGHDGSGRPIFRALTPVEDRDLDGRYRIEGSKLTVVEDARLKFDDVCRYIVINYEVADRTWDGHDSVLIYFFFDRHGRLLKHWVILKHNVIPQPHGLV